MYGATAKAGYAAYLKIDGFNILPVLSISMAGTTFTGQNVGAHKLDRVKKGMYSALAMVLIYTVFIGTVLLLSSHQVLGLFTHNANLIQKIRKTHIEKSKKASEERPFLHLLLFQQGYSKYLR